MILSIQGGIATVLSLTDSPDPNDEDHLGIVVSTRLIEREMKPAFGNATVSL